MVMIFRCSGVRYFLSIDGYIDLLLTDWMLISIQFNFAA